MNSNLNKDAHSAGADSLKILQNYPSYRFTYNVQNAKSISIVFE